MRQRVVEDLYWSQGTLCVGCGSDPGPPSSHTPLPESASRAGLQTQWLSVLQWVVCSSASASRGRHGGAIGERHSTRETKSASTPSITGPRSVVRPANRLRVGVAVEEVTGLTSAVTESHCTSVSAGVVVAGREQVCRHASGGSGGERAAV